MFYFDGSRKLVACRENGGLGSNDHGTRRYSEMLFSEHMNLSRNTLLLCTLLAELEASRKLFSASCCAGSLPYEEHFSQALQFA